MIGNDRFINGIRSTLKIMGTWETSQTVYTQSYDKYKIINIGDVTAALDSLVDTGEIQSKVLNDEKHYYLPTSNFEKLLNHFQISRFHLAEITEINEALIVAYCNGTKISMKNAVKIANKLQIETSEISDISDV